MKSLILFLFLFSVQHLTGQTTSITRNKVLNIFKASIKQDSKRRIKTHSNPWIICNDNNAYYKSDTIKLLGHATNYPSCECHCFIDWTFYKKDAYVLTRESLDEPRRVSATKAEDWYIIKLFRRDDDLILEAYNQNKLADQFKVLSIDSTLTLMRIREIQ